VTNGTDYYSGSSGDNKTVPVREKSPGIRREYHLTNSNRMAKRPFQGIITNKPFVDSRKEFSKVPLGVFISFHKFFSDLFCIESIIKSIGTYWAILMFFVVSARVDNYCRKRMGLVFKAPLDFFLTPCKYLVNI